ncbi:MAG: hypothetical protein GXY57_00165 [Erysipelotrichaceae bacterium]|jgi:hypothetical protein|nr:hypothetical protein [Bacilli bacterium]NLV28566.1 hypothetical protein [Erysipelotrichaceae bacterium]HPY79428.1 hypothetical protein [Bacilli bacterium]HQA55496.1 hypothetical protein [Bacilli bacterium]
MNYIELTQNEMSQHYVGAALTLTTVMALIAVAVVAVIAYRLFMSNKGSATVPGGWKFTWN